MDEVDPPQNAAAIPWNAWGGATPQQRGNPFCLSGGGVDPPQGSFPYLADVAIFYTRITHELHTNYTRITHASRGGKKFYTRR